MRAQAAIHLRRWASRSDRQLNAFDLQQLLRSCTSLSEGRKLHARIASLGYESNTFLSNHIVEMYLRCGSLPDARAKFEAMEQRDLVLWTAMVTGYAENGKSREALYLFREMELQGCRPDRVALLGAVKACSAPSFLRDGESIHGRITESLQGSQRIHLDHGSEQQDVIINSALVSMYSKCGDLQKAEQVFRGMQGADCAVLWGMLTYAYAQKGHYRRAFQLLMEMQLNGISPAEQTFTSCLGACSSPEALEVTRMIHRQAELSGAVAGTVVYTALVFAYGKCGDWATARKVFEGIPYEERDLICWNAMMGVHTAHGHSKQAMKLFEYTLLEGFELDVYSFVSLLNGFKGGVNEARRVLNWVVEAGLQWRSGIENSLVNLYGRCEGGLRAAKQVFESMLVRDMISWNGMLAAFVQNGAHNDAVELFQRMYAEGLTPDDVSFSLLLRACGALTDLYLGREVHRRIQRSEFGCKKVVQDALVYMYSKCACIEDAHSCFEAMGSLPCTSSWNALIAAYARRGRSDLSLKLFHTALQDGVRPNSVTFVAVLNACSHAGLVQQGCLYFALLQGEYKLAARKEHIGCLTDLLGRAGNLWDARNVLEQSAVAMEDDDALAPAWSSLLGSCKLFKDAENGKDMEELLSKYRPRQSACYVELSSIRALSNAQHMPP